MFGNCSHSNNDFISGLGTRHSMAAYNSMQAEWQQHEMALSTTQSCSFMAQTRTSLQEYSRCALSFSYEAEWLDGTIELSNESRIRLRTRPLVRLMISFLQWWFDKYLFVPMTLSFCTERESSVNMCIHSLNLIKMFFSISSTANSALLDFTNNSSLPPALPPKRSRSVRINTTPPPVSPKPMIDTQIVNILNDVVTSTPIKSEEPVVCLREKHNVTPTTPVKAVSR